MGLDDSGTWANSAFEPREGLGRARGPRQLKFRESASEAERGTEWIITDHGRPVARRAPLEDHQTPLPQRISRLGVASQAVGLDALT